MNAFGLIVLDGNSTEFIKHLLRFNLADQYNVIYGSYGPGVTSLSVDPRLPTEVVCHHLLATDTEVQTYSMPSRNLFCVGSASNSTNLSQSYEAFARNKSDTLKDSVMRVMDNVDFATAMTIVKSRPNLILSDAHINFVNWGSMSALLFANSERLLGRIIQHVSAVNDTSQKKSPFWSIELHREGIAVLQPFFLNSKWGRVKKRHKSDISALAYISGYLKNKVVEDHSNEG